jgi:DNA (cytosine-5)-methyltransferase 1
MGYHRAFPDAHIVGVDIVPQPDYPFDFRLGDALIGDFSSFDLIHASPPCQHFTRYRNVHKDITDRYEDLIPATRDVLVSNGSSYIIENVPNSPIAKDLELCGSMFNLDIRRHSWFEYGNMEPPILFPPQNHLNPRKFKPSSNRSNLRRTIEIGAWNEPLELQQQAMECEWITDLRQLSEAIPPAYTQWIGEQINERT